VKKSRNEVLNLNIFDKPVQPETKLYSGIKNPIRMAFWRVPRCYTLEPEKFDSFLFDLTGVKSKSIPAPSSFSFLKDKPQTRMSTFFETLPSVFIEIERNLEEGKPRRLVSNDTVLNFEWTQKSIICVKCGCKGHDVTQCDIQSPTKQKVYKSLSPKKSITTQKVVGQKKIDHFTNQTKTKKDEQTLQKNQTKLKIITTPEGNLKHTGKKIFQK
jgi:hypothetical protein